MAKFDKPYKTNINIDSSKIADLFSIVDNMDTFEIKNFSLINKIPLSVQDNNGNNLIHHTILNSSNNTELQRLNFIKFLYNENVNPDAPNKDNITPLLYACMKQYKLITEYLINIGVDINYRDNFNNNSYNYLFSSMIKNYNVMKQKSIIPAIKEIDQSKINLLKNHRKDLWEKIKYHPALNSIIQTIKKSIGSNIDAYNIIRSFQETLIEKVINTNKLNDIEYIKEIYSVNLNKFIDTIIKAWNNFPKTQQIEIHKSTIDSCPSINESNYGIIRNCNYKSDIKNKLDETINNIIKNVLNNNNIVDIVNLDTINRELLTELLVNNNPQMLATYTLNNFSSYDDYNKYIHYNCIDNADNIINYEYNTFAGGSRLFNIVSEVDKEFMLNLQDKDTQNMIGALVYTLILDYNISINFNGTFDLSNNNIENTIVLYIYSLILNDDIIKNENRFINVIKGSGYDYLITLIPQKNNYNLGHFIYVLCTAYIGIKNNINDNESNLTGGIQQTIILLCSAVYHNKNDIKKSIYNVFKPIYIKDINGINVFDYYKKWINLLLYDDKYIINNNGNLGLNFDNSSNELILIIELVNKYFQNIQFNNNDRNIINLDSNISDCEYLGLIIVNYYQKMDNKPLLQNLVDTLVLIRLFEINKTREPKLNDQHFINRLNSLYLSPINFPDITTIRENSNIEFTKLDTNNIDKYFNTIFNVIEDKKIFEQITQYQIPSRINYYLYGGNEYLTSIGSGPSDEQKMFLMKQIEANHFGLNFIGLIPKLSIIDNINIQVPIDTTLNLYNYNHDLNNVNNYFFNTYGYDILNRPPTYMAYTNLLQHFKNRLNSLENIIFPKLRKIFQELKNNNSKLYSKAIGYYYPILNSLETHEAFFQKHIIDIANHEKSTLPPNYTGEYMEYMSDTTFNLNAFNSDINKINGLLFLYYYLGSNIVDIPKFIYHQIGDNPITIFNDPNINVSYPMKPINNIRPGINTDTTNIDKRTGTHAYIGNIDYSNIINNIINRRFFISRDIINKSFIQSKDMKLPPSLISVYNEFLNYNVIDIIKNIIDTPVNDDIVESIIDINPEMKNISKKLLNAKLSQDIIINYIKNNVYKIGYEMFEKIINKNIDVNFDITTFFGDVNFDVSLNNENIDISLLQKEYIANFYKFSEPVIKQNTFILYPNNYNSINLVKKFFKIDVNKDIIELLLNAGCNIFNTNNENEISIINLLKYYNYSILEHYKNLGIDYRIFSSDKYTSPLKFILAEYKNNINRFISDNDYGKQILSFTDSQFKDVVFNLMGNDKLGFNIIKNLQISFGVCNYITQQFLTESLYNFNDQFNFDDINYIYKNLLMKNYNNFINLFYENNINKLPNNDINILITELIKNKEKENDELNNEINNINKKINELNKVGLNIIKLVQKKNNMENKINENNNYITQLNSLNNNNMNPVNINNIQMKILKRYDTMLNLMNNQRMVYMSGWDYLFKNNIRMSNENMIQQVLNIEYTKISDNIGIDYRNFLYFIERFYSQQSQYCEKYFQNQYIEHNKILGFVKDLLIHLTQNVICVGIETLIRRILFEYIISTQDTNIDDTNDKMNFIINKFKDYLYNKLAENLVMNNTNVFINEYEENEFLSNSTSDLINNSIDYLIETTPIPFNNIVIDKLKSITGYFETLTPKLINNWRVTIENQFLFTINHSRILKCINIVL
jgi:hypothetical protein